MIIRLNELNSLWSLFYFLSYRCDDTFIKRNFERCPELLNKLIKSIKVHATNSRIDLIYSLNKSNFLSEEQRNYFLSSLKEYIKKEIEIDILKDPKIKELLTGKEIKQIKKLVVENLPNTVQDKLEDMIFDYDYDFDDEPDEYFYPLIKNLEEWRAEFSDHTEIREDINDAISEIEWRIDDLKDQIEDEREKEKHSFDPKKAIDESDNKRSIFDDIDK